MITFPNLLHSNVFLCFLFVNLKSEKKVLALSVRIAVSSAKGIKREQDISVTLYTYFRPDRYHVKDLSYQIKFC